MHNRVRTGSGKKEQVERQKAFEEEMQRREKAINDNKMKKEADMRRRKKEAADTWQEDVWEGPLVDIAIMEAEAEGKESVNRQGFKEEG